MKRDKVVSVRVDDSLFEEIKNIAWWDHYRFETESDVLRYLLKLGVKTWKIEKGLPPDIKLEIEHV